MVVVAVVVEPSPKTMGEARTVLPNPQCPAINNDPITTRKTSSSQNGANAKFLHNFNRSAYSSSEPSGYDTCCEKLGDMYHCINGPMNRVMVTNNGKINAQPNPAYRIPNQCNNDGS